MSQIIRKQPSELYHQNTEFIGSSSLKEMEKSPAHFYQAWKGKREETDALINGRFLHSVVLEQDLSSYSTRPVNADGSLVRSNSKEYKEWESNLAGKTPIKPDMYEQAMGFINSFCANSEAMKLYNGAEIETSFYHKDKETGLSVKCRPDILGINYIADYKTCNMISKFNNDIFSLNYLVQAGHYVDVVEQVQGCVIDNYYFIAQEKAAPYGIKIFRMNKNMIDYAKTKRRELLNRVAIAVETNSFPGYAEIIQDVVIPKWTVSESIFEEVG